MGFYKNSVGNLALLTVLLLSGVVHAQSFDNEYMTDGILLGTATYGIAFWDKYELSLYSEQEPLIEGEPPYALEFQFLKEYTDNEFVDRVISQVRANGISNEIRLARWHSHFLNIIPDITDGTVITAIYSKDKETHFYSGEEYLGYMRDPVFARRFFSIWIGNSTSPESKVREQLLGLLN